MRRLLLFITFCLSACFVSAADATVKLAEMDKVSTKAKAQIDGIHFLERYLSEAKQAKNDTFVAKAYRRLIYYYIVTVKNSQKTTEILSRLNHDNLPNRLKADVRINMIFWYQYIGDPLKSVSLCREILKTSKDKMEVADATFNMFLLYYNCGMLETARDRISDLCKFSETITDKPNFHYCLTMYSVYAAMLNIETNRPQQALQYLIKTDSIWKNDGRKTRANYSFEAAFRPFIWGEYYIAVNDDAKFWGIIAELKAYNTLDVQRLIYELEFRYYLKKHDYAKADVAMFKFKEAMASIGMNFDDAGYTLIEAKIANGLGDYKRATMLYQKYVVENDSINKLADKLRTDEYAVQLDLDKANIEKSEYEAKASHYRLQVVILVALISVIAVICAALFIIYLRKINKRLQSVNGKLKKSYERVEALGRMKTSLIMNMSREIRGPLGGITGFSQVLSSMDDNLKQYTDIIDSSSNNIRKILDDVVATSELENNDIEIEPVNVNECCYNAIFAIKDNKPENVTFSYEPSDTNLTINGNNRWLIRIVNNLLDNSFKFTAEGSVVLRYAVENDKLHLSVTDTGCGIPVDKAEWVFENFTKINKLSAGTGLGLYVCRMIVLKLDGSIKVDTGYHDGCKIDVYLPNELGMQEA